LVCYGDALEKAGLPDSALSVFNFCKKKCQSFINESIKIPEQTLIPYLECLNSMALLNMNKSNFHQASNLFEEAFSIFKNYHLNEENNFSYVLSLDNYGGLLLTIGEYRKALNIFNEAKNLFVRFLRFDSLFYSKILNNIGTVYQSLGQYQNALPFFKESFAIKSRFTDEHQEYYINGLNNLAALYLMMARYDDALKIFKKLDAVTINFGEESQTHLNALNNLAFTYASMKKIEEAKRTAQKYLHLNLANNKNKPAVFAFSLGAVGYIYLAAKNYSKAIFYLDSSLNAYNRIPSANLSDILKIKNNLATAYEDIGDYNKAITIYLEIIPLHRKIYPYDVDTRFSYLTNLMVAYSSTGKMEEALKYLGEASQAIKTQMQDRLGIQSTEEKEKYINNIDNILQILKSMASKSKGNSKNRNASIIYNSELMMKGFLFNSEEKTKIMIQDSKDSAQINLYLRWKDDKLKLIAEKSAKLNVSYISNLEKRIEAEERDLSSNSHIFNYQLEEFNTDWQKIKDSLSDKEMLVDFFFYRNFTNKVHSTGSITYAAMVIKKDSKFPIWIDLFKEVELTKIIAAKEVNSNMIDRDKINFVYGVSLENNGDNSSENINNEKLFNLIWRPLMPYFKGASKIYFIPIKNLGTISLLALHNSKAFLIDNFDMEELQNGLEVCKARDKDLKIDPDSLRQIHSALFGGIQYNFPLAELQKLYLSTRVDSAEFYDSLPETRNEISAISELLKEKGVSTVIYEDENASEENIKSLNRNSPEILLIATHGFFEDDTSNTKMSDPLVRARLLLARGNYVLGGGKIPNDMDDGILNANEASLLDFRKTKLLILSACQTGVGEVRGSEGIYNLERGFKLSGVNYIIVSLWKISDQASSRFMKILFEQLCNGKRITNAFQATQLKMKLEYKYNPYFWGAFKLVR
jgi:CHAT domain-containing protein